MNSIIANIKLKSLFDAVESTNIPLVQFVLETMKGNTDINQAIERRDRDNHSMLQPPAMKRSVDIFQKVLEKNTSYLDKKALFEIFKMLHIWGMEWENHVVTFQGHTTSQHMFDYFTKFLLENDHIDFFIKILPLAKNMNAIWDRDVRRYPVPARKTLRDRLCSYINSNSEARLKTYISCLTPEIKIYLVAIYVSHNQMLKFAVSKNPRMYSNILNLMKLLKIVNIDCGGNDPLKSSYIDSNKLSIESMLEWKQKVSYADLQYENSEVLIESSEQIYTTLCLLISSGFGSKEIDKNHLLKESMAKFLLARNNRWLLQREKPLYNYLPIPLEARLCLWENGLGGRVFDRRQSSILLQM